MEKTLTLCALCLLSLCLWPAQALLAATNAKATYPIGEVVVMQGNAWLGSDEKKTALKEGDPVFLHSRITTGADARLFLMFIDDTEITLGEKASFTIDDYILDPYDPNENKGSFSVKGDFYWTSGEITKRDPPRVDIVTENGSISPIGTSLWGGPLQDFYGLYVTDGRVNYAGNWGIVNVPVKRGVRIEQSNIDGAATPEAEDWPRDRTDAAMKTVAFDLQGTYPLEEKLRQMRKDNIAKRHDYRGRVFPYKDNPFEPRIKVKEDKFFSDEFDAMRGR